LSLEKVPVRSIDVATRLDVSRASVNKAVGLLKESGFVIQQPYGGITLTEKGKEAAAKVRMCHTMIGILLNQLLGVPKETAEEEACKIEHVISDDTLSRLVDYVEKNFAGDLLAKQHLFDGKRINFENNEKSPVVEIIENNIENTEADPNRCVNDFFEIAVICDSDEKSRICRNILESLPDWFGIPSAITDYADQVRDLPFWCAVAEGRPVGFVSVKIHHGCTAELMVMGVYKEYHRKGIGRRLVEKCREYASDMGCIFLTVKTLSPEVDDIFYERTRNFYLSVGFHPIETFPQIWDEANPCLLMGMFIGEKAQ